MKYFGKQQDTRSNSGRLGVLLLNLGTPDRAVCPSLRQYLAEFLMDPRVIELPKLLRLILVRGIIVNLRSHKSAANYRKVWTDEGSPLLLNSQQLTTATAAYLGDDYQVEVAMRYGQPSIKNALKKLHNDGVRELVILPLYPQYSGSTNGSSFDAVANALRSFRWVPSVHFINCYYQYDAYISAVANSIQRHWQKNGKAKKLLLSFHGVPEKFITQGDPYEKHCSETAKAIAERLNIANDEWMLVYQSRLGAQQWLEPYCDKTLMALPAEGIDSVDIVCPGFSVDCLETLEEIDGENREYFLGAGGKQYSYIPCLNAHPSHAEMIASLVSKYKR